MPSHHNLTPPAETPPTLSDGVMAPTGASTPLQCRECRSFTPRLGPPAGPYTVDEPEPVPGGYGRCRSKATTYATVPADFHCAKWQALVAMEDST